MSRKSIPSSRLYADGRGQLFAISEKEFKHSGFACPRCTAPVKKAVLLETDDGDACELFACDCGRAVTTWRLVNSPSSSVAWVMILNVADFPVLS